MKPAYYTDSVTGVLSDSTRFFYLSLWGIADDAGWLTRNIPEIGAAVWMFHPRAGRERKTAARLAELVALGRVIEHPCGHLEIPTMPGHQHLAGTTRQVRTTFNQHLRECVSAHPREDPRVPAETRLVKERKGEERLGKERVGYTAPAGAIKHTNDDGTTTEFSSRVGPFGDIVKGIPR